MVFQAGRKFCVLASSHQRGRRPKTAFITKYGFYEADHALSSAFGIVIVFELLQAVSNQDSNSGNVQIDLSFKETIYQS